MEFKNIEEMISTKNAYKNRKLEYQNAIKDAKLSKRETKGHSKSYWDEVISHYKDIVKSLEEEIQNISNEITKLSSFPEEILMPFLIECINLYEDEPFVYRKVMLNYTINYVEHSFPNFMFYDLIFPESLLEEETVLERTFFISKMPSAYQELLDRKASKYLMLTNLYERSLIPDDSLHSYFKEFPYLEMISFNLVNRRLLEPDKSLIDILNEELEEQKNKGIKKEMN